MSVKAQGVNLFAGISAEETLQSSVTSQGTLQAEITTQRTLQGTVASQKTLQATVTSQRNLHGRATKASYTVDSELSDKSENPVQNKIVTAALDKKLEQINFATNTDIYKLFT